ncbi:MAG: GNAT family N-acetyltransferase, partial [Chloroflexi bacterium]|nr:GNAT family N-acetyltransferase [Chloroflexota bacterium]
MSDFQVLDKRQGQFLATLLPESTETVISRAHLRWGTAQAYAVGLMDHGFETAVIEDPGCPGEPMVFGENPIQIANLLPHIPDWLCVNVTTKLAPQLAPLLAKKMGYSLRQMADVYHVLTQPPPGKNLAHPAVRLLTAADLPLLLAAPPELRGSDPAHLLQKTAVAAAIINNQIVAIAQNYALTEKYGDIGVFTLPSWRGHGFASAAAALVAQWLQGNDRIPVWSCGEHNQASLQVAKKLGFVENGRRV